MTPEPGSPATPGLVEHAKDTRVVVIGAGIAGLVAARECARLGMSVTVLEAGDRPGGCIVAGDPAQWNGMPVDLVVDSFAIAAPELNALIDDLGLRADVENESAPATWITGLAAGAAPLPVDALLGIPANPWSDQARAFIGWRGAWRAYVDRLRPPLTIGHQRSLGALVRSRMGDRVADRMVAPLTEGLHGLAPEQVDTEAIAPGLSTALTRTGSLAGAVSQLLPSVASAPRRATLRGGMTALVDALTARLRELDVAVHSHARAERIEAGTTKDASAAPWRVIVSAPAPDEGDPGAPDAAAPGPALNAPAPDATESAPVAPLPHELDADLVIVATPEASARALLGSAGVDLPASEGAPELVDVVTLLVDAPALDRHPRGTAVYPVPGTSAARAVHHVTASWPHLARGVGQHLLRVVLPHEEGRSATAAAELARTEAGSLIGVELAASSVRAVQQVTIAPAYPASLLGHGDRRAAIRQAVAGRRGVAVVGGWVAGSGLAAVVADAVAETERARSSALWATD